MNLRLQEEVDMLRRWLDEIDSRINLLKLVRKIMLTQYSESTRIGDLGGIKHWGLQQLVVGCKIDELSEVLEIANQEYKQAVANFNQMMAKAC